VLPFGVGGRPFTLEPEERALWARAQTEEVALRERVRVYEDPRLEDYLAGVGARLLPDAARAAGAPVFRVTVVRDPTLNAFALPNGRIYLHTGLLSRLENEAQLAAVLAHEMAHVIGRDAFRCGRDAGPAAREVPPRLVTAGAAGPGIPRAASAVFGPTARTVLGLDLRVSARASMRGYGPDLEREADAAAMAMLVQAGYDPAEAPRIYARLREEAAAGGVLETFVLGRDAALAARAESARDLVRTTYAAAAGAPESVRDTEAFGLRIGPVVRDNAVEDIRLGRFSLARAQLDRVLATAPDDAVAHLHYGDLHRLQAQRAADAGARAKHARQALARYERAIALDPALAEPHRQLGLLYHAQQDAAQARAAFERYLVLRPDAPDARRIREYVAELDR
jgi:predicted Zn-dependent protease